MDLIRLKENVLHAFENYLGGIIARLPSIASGLLVLLIGWLIARLLRAIVKNVTRRAGVDKLAERTGLSNVFGKVGVKKLSSLLAAVVYGLSMLIVIVATAEVMHMSGVTKAIDRFFGYLPTLATALAIFVAGLWGADKAKAQLSTLMDSVGLGGARVVASLLSGCIVLFTTITALNVAGVDTTLITSNILVVMAGVLLAFSIAYGYAARDILTNILGSYYGKDRFKPGMRVRVGNDEGVIERIDSLSIAIRTNDRLILLPTKQLVTERIEILDPLEEE